MSTQMNKAAVRRLYEELMGRGDTSVADELIDPAYVDHDIPGHSAPGRRDDLQATVLGVRAAFPDIVPTLHEMIAEGDWVSIRVEAAGHHTGTPFLGVNPSGRPMTWKEVHHFRLSSGRIVENRGVFDMLAIMQQLGALSGAN